MMRLIPIVIGLGCAATVQCSAWANVVKADDADRIYTLSRKAGEIGKGVGEAGNAALLAMMQSRRGDASEAVALGGCISQLRNSLSDAMYVLHFTSLILQTSSVMLDKVDESTSLVAVDAAISAIRDRIQDLRLEANRAAGTCRNSAMVNAKAQAVLDFATVIEQVVEPLSHRVKGNAD